MRAGSYCKSRMYKDNSLIPSEAVRLAALGLLAKRPRVYADLAREIRHFTARIVGPSLDLLGPSLELLKVEGLVEATDPKAPHDTQTVRLTKDGEAELHRLMNANLRGPMGEVNKLIVALKLHFLDLLTPEQRRQQLEMLMEVCDRELIRLNDLRDQHTDTDSALLSWLDHEIEEVQRRRDWFLRLAEGQKSGMLS
jgi:DNA-binding PadR family transcriptional regulator